MSSRAFQISSSVEQKMKTDATEASQASSTDRIVKESVRHTIQQETTLKRTYNHRHFMGVNNLFTATLKVPA